MEELEMILLEGEEKMDKALKSYDYELTSIRTGRASASLLDQIKVDYYGAPMPVKQVSSISVPEGNQLYIKPFDKSMIKPIEAAIYASNLGLTPQSDSNGIRLIIPQMTEDRRKDLVKQVGKLEEAAKVQIRNVRRDLNDQIKKLDLPEDEEKSQLEDVQKLTDNKIKEIEAKTEAKNKDLMSV